MWNNDTKFKLLKSLPSNQIGEDFILLDAKATKTHELNGVAKFIWSELTTPKSINELSTSLQDIYDIDNETLVRDITSFLIQLEELALIAIDE